MNDQEKSKLKILENENAILREKVKILEERDQLFIESIKKSTSYGFWIINKFGQFIDANETYLKFIGYSKAELLNLKAVSIDALESEEETLSRISRIIKNRSETFRTKHRAKSGYIYDIEITAIYTGKDGGLTYFFAKDLSPEIKINLDLQERVKELKAFFSSFRNCRD